MTKHSQKLSSMRMLGRAATLSVCAFAAQAHAAEPADKADEKLQSFELDALHDTNQQAASPQNADTAAISQQLDAMMAELKAQRALIAEQNATIARQQMAINSLVERQSADADLMQLRGAGAAPGAPPNATAQNASSQSSPAPGQTVGEAPPPGHEIAADIMAVPVAQGVLTPPGSTVLESSFEYIHTSQNRLVFRGIELIPGLQLGLIEASDADRNTMVETIALRRGITNRLEIEARMPVLARQDRIQVAQQREGSIARSVGLHGFDVGDAEVALRYQLNDAKGPDQPIYVANLRIKSNTGRGPFDVGYDEFGVAKGLATGSGFWGVQGGVSFLLPSDPVVIYGGTSYLWHIPGNVNKLISGAFVGRVDPGDAISANLGFGFALNPRFSFSLGYNHSYIFPTKTEIGGTNQRSTSLQVGSFSVGTSYRISERQSVNIAFEFGMTSDAPDVSMSLRLPLRF
jgi:hypothetical protein